jgi:hypothetical protein
MKVTRTGWQAAALVGTALIATAALAESAPAGLVACQDETDASARLACYDREMGRLHPRPPPAAPAAPASIAPAAMVAPAPASIAPAATAVAPVPPNSALAEPAATQPVPAPTQALAPTVPPPPATAPAAAVVAPIPTPRASPAIEPSAAAPAAAAAATTSPALSAEQRFGLNGAQLAQNNAATPPELKSLDAHVVEVSPMPAGGVVLDLDNGQRWQQTSLDQDLMLKPGDAVHIRRATFGSFMLSAGSGRFARVKRLH